MKSKGFRRVLGTMGAVLAVTALTACSTTSETSNETSSKTTDSKTIKNLRVMFVPSKDADAIVTATKPLNDLLKAELKKEGYEVEQVDVSVGTNFEAVGEALASGSADVGFGVPGGTYALYKDETEVVLTATRAGLSKDSDDAKAWNDGKATEATDKQATSYRSILIAGPSEKGQELAAKVNKGEKLTWEDLNSANWGLSSTTSSAGYVYPALWLKDNADHSITDLKSAVTIDSYGSGFARLASGQIDVLPVYADARRDFEKAWTAEYGQSKGIWEETNVIGVTPGIYNDAVLVSKQSEIIDDGLKAALSNALISMAQTEEGKKVIAIYSHEGYKSAKESDYENEFKAKELMKGAN